MSSASIQTVTYEFRSAEPVPVGRVPRVTRHLALAHTIEERIRSREIRDWAEAARLVGVTRARMTQIAKLLLLAPQIQESILSLPNVARGPDPVTERALRMVVAEVDWRSQEVARLGPSFSAGSPALDDHAVPPCDRVRAWPAEAASAARPRSVSYV